MKVIVVGGGLAGIAAALRAADNGADVTLLERRSRIGGLTWSFVRDGRSFDNGQHVFLRCCTAYRSFLDRVGASDLVHLQPRLDVPVLAPGGRTARLRRAPLPAPFHLGPSLARYSHLSVGERAQAVRAALALRRLDPDDPALDTSDFGTWLDRHGQSPRALAHLWELIARPTLNLAVGEASLGAAVKVFRTGLLDAADAADIGWATAPLGVAHGQRATAALEAAGVEIVTDAAAGPVQDGDRLRVGLPDRRLDADAVILAVPHDVVGALVPPGTLAAGVEPERLGHSPVVDVHLVLDRRVTDLPMAAVVDSPLQFVFDRTGSAGEAHGQVIAVSLSAAASYLTARPEALIGEMTEALAALFPLVAKATVVDAVVTKERNATFHATPGARAHRAGTRTGHAGILLAGTWTDTGWPATMEGAVRSGTAAADALLAAPTTHLVEQGARA